MSAPVPPPESRAWASADLTALARRGTSISVDPARLHEASGDFGNLVRGRSIAVAMPRNQDELGEIVRFAHERSLSYTARAFGRSAGGQSVTASGVTLDVSRLDDIGAIDMAGLRITCGPGATWRSVVRATLEHGLLPRVVPLNLDLSVGGTLSVGGIGSNSHLFGMCAGNVANVDAVLGDGRRVSSTTDPEVLDATMGTLGQLCLIASTTLELRRARPKVQTYSLLYDDLDKWMEDQARARDERRFDYMEGFCSAAMQGLRKSDAGRQPFGKWFYGLHVSVEHDADSFSSASVLDGMRHQWVVNDEESSIEEYTSRADARFGVMARTGAYAMPHPWMEWFVSPESLTSLLPEILQGLFPSLGDGQRVVQLARSPKPSMVMTAGKDNVVFAVLPPAVAPAALGVAQPALRKTNEALAAAGARRYLAGWLEIDAAGWQRHYGARHERWLELKRKFDPSGVFASVCFLR